MPYTGLELFMENLLQLSYNNNHPVVNCETILSKRPQMQRLYQELGDIIQILFVEEQSVIHEMEQVRNLKIRLKDVAQEAHNIVGLFVYYNYRKPKTRHSIYGSVKYFLNYQKQLDVVSIVGMGGLGKTTLATKVFNDPFVVYHFHIRAWVTISQTYETHDLLIQLLASVCPDFDPVNASALRLREKLHKSLIGKRYLIVVDDIWSIKAWDNLKLFFPNNNKGSRVLLTSRLNEVALHAKSHGFVHQLELLTDEESCELLCKKVFHRDDFPKSLIEPGKEIAKKCRGLPLAVATIAGVLAKEAMSTYSWQRIAECVGSYIMSDQTGNVDVLALSYDHLPLHLKNCFLYFGGFPEDHRFQAQHLIWLWMAEGFIEEDGKRSLEEIGEDYLMELVDRNLVTVVDRKFNRAIKTCSVHDLLREFCLQRAQQEHFCLKIDNPRSSFSSMGEYKPRRIFTNRVFKFNNFSHQPFPWVHSLLWLHNNMSSNGVGSTKVSTTRLPLSYRITCSLKLIDVDDSNSAVVESLVEIREEQQNFGNYDLKINVRKKMHRLLFYKKLRGLAWMVDWQHELWPLSSGSTVVSLLIQVAPRTVIDCVNRIGHISILSGHLIIVVYLCL
ncbi:hypothetical protein E3N88_04727 [Mikania micrantha]|uniref:Uncharacterized protein n=1 Tax=Mikania micrantha TaxID=192012 RepID=A0A5N6PV87_9ASTR|nr:hypothetical protein E3N88_04727 [Mikania micrantha]